MNKLSDKEREYLNKKVEGLLMRTNPLLVRLKEADMVMNEDPMDAARRVGDGAKNLPSWLYAYSPESDYAEPDDRLLPSGWWIGLIAWAVMLGVLLAAITVIVRGL